MESGISRNNAADWLGSARASRSAVEIESRDTFFQLCVSRRTRRQPFPQSFHLHECADFRIVKGHTEKRIDERLPTICGQARAHREIAVVKGWSGCQHAGRAWIERAFVDEHAIVCVEHARGIGGFGRKRPRCIALSTNMVAVLSDHNIVIENLAVTKRIKT